jgi:dihydrofolate synthase/folylpolyglutamate synthase
MTYSETLDYLYRKLPMFTRIGAAALKNDLNNTIALCDHLNNPQKKFKTIHIAGTNGKGSTSHMLAAIFQQAGYKTGLYTSPHLKDFRERIRINGTMVSEEFVSHFVENEQEIIETISPSFFEVTVAMAFSYFAQEKVDIAIIEVGLGGRLDSTNVITPELSIITNISLDHTNILGNRLEDIAYEKAGIIKPGVPVVIGERQSESQQVFNNKANETGSPISYASDTLSIDSFHMENNVLHCTILKEGEIFLKDLLLDLTGAYQLKNILTVLKSVAILKHSNYILSDADVRLALSNVVKLTGLQGRWQTLQKEPLVICDTGHNIAGITEVLINIRQVPYKRLHMVIGMVKDKDIDGILTLLPKDAIYYWTQPDIERAMLADDLATKASSFGLKGDAFKDVNSAINNAKNAALADDLIFVGGSTFVVAEVL